MKIQKLDLFFGLYIFCIIMAEMMGAKTFDIVTILWYQVRSSVAIFLVPAIYSINDIIIEVYGKERMKSILRVSLLLVALIIPVTRLFVNLDPSARFEAMQGSYSTIFWLSMRISLASLVALAVADFLDIYIFAKLKEKMQNYGLRFRNNLSNILAQWVDTIVFMTLAFYSLNIWVGENLWFIISIWFPYRILKCCMSAIGTPLVYLWVNRLKKDS